MSIADTLLHKWLRIPYKLHVHKKKVRKGVKVTYIFIHGLGDTAALWEPVIEGLNDSVNYVSVDLLGFGSSKKPAWARYNATMQARSLLMTYISLGIRGDVVVVGHSLGSLVAVEFAKRYPRRARQGGRRPGPATPGAWLPARQEGIAFVGHQFSTTSGAGGHFFVQKKTRQRVIRKT